MPFCTACGKQNPDDARFCSNCGTKLVSDVAAEAPGPDEATATMITERGQDMLPPRRDGQNGQPVPPNGRHGN